MISQYKNITIKYEFNFIQNNTSFSKIQYLIVNEKKTRSNAKVDSLMRQKMQSLS